EPRGRAEYCYLDWKSVCRLFVHSENVGTACVTLGPDLFPSDDAGPHVLRGDTGHLARWRRTISIECVSVADERPHSDLVRFAEMMATGGLMCPGNPPRHKMRPSRVVTIAR